MIKSRQLVSMPIISLENGEQLGKVKTLILDPKKLSISGLTLEQKVLFKDPKVIPFDAVEHIGEHAVTVTSSKSVIKASQDPEIAGLVKNPTNLTGSKVLTENGKVLGTVAEFCLNPQDGIVTFLELSNNLADKLFKGPASLPGSAVKTVGKAAVIVGVDAEELLQRPENQLQETIKTIKNQSTKIWDNTLETTKKLGDNLNKSWENISRSRKAKPGAHEQDEKIGDD